MRYLLNKRYLLTLFIKFINY